jgi:3-hydroxyisobutyrate dehydrogenase
VWIAVLGTGAMGAPMAENLARAGHDVVVWNRTRAKAEAVEGATVADTPADAARDAEAVLTMLTDGAAVESAVRDIDALPLWIQMSTVEIDATERLLQIAKERGATFVDAPVLGSREPAQRGELVVVASGPEDVRPTCTPVFDAVGKKTIWVGEAGAGTRLKVVANSWLQLFFDAIADGPLDLPYGRAKGREMIAREFPPSFALKLADKDANLALTAATRAGLELHVARAVAEELDQALALGHGDEDLAAVYFAVKREGAERQARRDCRYGGWAQRRILRQRIDERTFRTWRRPSARP